jgi:hypothetical protein
MKHEMPGNETQTHHQSTLITKDKTMTEQPEDERKAQRKAALQHLAWMLLAAFILLLVVYPSAFR